MGGVGSQGKLPRSRRGKSAAAVICAVIAGVLLAACQTRAQHANTAVPAAHAPLHRLQAENAKPGSTVWQSAELQSDKPVADASGALHRRNPASPTPGSVSATANAGCGADCSADGPSRLRLGQPITLCVSAAQPARRHGRGGP